MSVNQGDKITFQWLQSNILTPLEQQWKKRDFGDPNYNCTSYTIPNDFRNIITQGKIISVDDINQIKTNMDNLYDNYCKVHYNGHKHNQYSSQYTNNRSDHHITYYYTQNFTLNESHLYNHKHAIQTGHNNGYKSNADNTHHQLYYYDAYIPHNNTYKNNVNSTKHVVYNNNVDTGHLTNYYGNDLSSRLQGQNSTHHPYNYSTKNDYYDGSDFYGNAVCNSHLSGNLSSHLSTHDVGFGCDAHIDCLGYGCSNHCLNI